MSKYTAKQYHLPMKKITAKSSRRNSTIFPTLLEVHIGLTRKKAKKGQSIISSWVFFKFTFKSNLRVVETGKVLKNVQDF